MMESLGLLSLAFYTDALNSRDKRETDTTKFVRHESTSNLFYDQDLDDQIEIRWNDNLFSFRFENGRFTGIVHRDGSATPVLDGDYQNVWLGGAAGWDRSTAEMMGHFKSYRFERLDQFPRLESDYHSPAVGGQHALLALGTQRTQVGGL